MNLVILIIVCSAVLPVRTNANPKNILKVDAERNRYIDPSTFMAACLCESSERRYDELRDSGLRFKAKWYSLVLGFL